MDPLPIEVPGYELAGLLHESAESQVWRGVRKRDAAAVALKWAAGNTPVARQLTMLRNEFELLRGLDVPGVVRAHELLRLQGQLALVVDLVPGLPLREWVRRERPALEARLQAAIAAARVIGAVHAAGVIHRSINGQVLYYAPGSQTVHLVDFGRATRLHAQESQLRGVALDGALAYIAPEQTGRMNRSVDHRADWYAFGVTLYELFSGRLPRESRDPLELVHFHIAGMAAPLHEIAEVPPALSAVVAKLMRKAPEERYQSAAGLLADLERCLQGLRQPGAIPDFEPGAHDVIAGFELAERLYGRDSEVAQLAAALQRVATGNTCTIRITGAAGVGKTALVQEMHPVITACGGFLAAGKFDQLRHDVPYSALVDALQGLVEQLLTGGPEAAERWREDILAAVGSNGRVLVDVIPALELLIGAQPAVPLLTGIDAQKRFMLVFQNFIQVFARRAHPLVLFLDDMQWADQASLNLLTRLLSMPGTEALLVLQAYRDPEAEGAHALSMALQEQERIGVEARALTLAPMGPEDVAALLADTLRAPLPQVAGLAGLICERTGGNPFLVRQFLRSLHAEGLVVFDAQRGGFSWDMQAVRRAAITDNIADFVAARLARLPDRTRDALKVAAAIGARFDLPTLATVLCTSEQEVAARLAPALEAELLVPLSPLEIAGEESLEAPLVHRRHAFLHDRVQRAAYDLIPAADIAGLHLQIGRLLWGGRTAEQLGARLFEVVNHLNLGIPEMHGCEERLELARLNYCAGLRARNATAYALAIRAFRQALALIGGAAGWDQHHRRAYEGHLKLAEALALNAQHAEAFVVIQDALARASSRLQRTRLRALQVSIHLSIGQMVEALDCGCAAAAEFGVHLPQDAATLERILPGEIDAVLAATGSHGIERLLDLPAMLDEEKLALMALLPNCLPAAFQTNQALYALISCRIISLSIADGHCAHSARGYVSFAGVLSNALGRYEEAFRFARLAVDLLQRVGDTTVLPGAYFVWALMASHWVRPVDESIALFENAVHHGLLTGDHLHAAYSAARRISHQQFRGLPLQQVHEDALAARELLLRVGERHKLNYLEPRIRFIEWLRDGVREDLGTEETDEAGITAAIRARGNRSFEADWFVLLLINRYLRGEYAQALAVAREAHELLPYSAGFVTRSEQTLFHALTLTALLPGAAAPERAQFNALLDEQEAELARFSAGCAANFRHGWLLVRAERARVAGDVMAALSLYDQAIACAAEHGFLHVEALAAERAMRFWFETGQPAFAALYLERAVHAYESWGAQARVRALREGFRLRAPRSAGTARSGPSPALGPEDRAGSLDLATLLKASQVLSGEILLDRLLERLLKIILENAAGDRVVLVLQGEERPLVQGLRDELSGEAAILMDAPLQGTQLLSEGLANYVIRTRETLVLTEPAQHARFRQDPYLAQRRPKSVLCAPILHQGKLTGLVYIENNQLAGAFTPGRLEAINVLMLQIAVSIENATLYAQRERQARRIEQANAALTREIEERAQAERELERYRDHLEELVSQRTRELEGAQDRLVDLSRRAGMAEVASGVLHNVGNVMNSVNVAAQVACESLRCLPVERLDKVCDLLARPAGDLAHWLQQDEAGRHLPEYLRQLSRALGERKQAVRSELEHVLGQLEHMKKIIAAQQSHAKAQGVSEVCTVQEIADTALSISDPALRAASVRVIRQYAALPPGLLDRHQILQILVNLISNACHAMEAIAAQDRQLALQVQAEGDMACIEVRDNGVGIPADNLARVFTHGFTTRQSGHGFGLHNAANAAQQMGGSLVAHSEGPGHGARFVLRVPLRADCVQEPARGVA